MGMMTVGMLGVMGGKVMRWDGFDSGDKGMANLYTEEIMLQTYRRTTTTILSCKWSSNVNLKATIKTEGMMMNPLQLDLLLGPH